jgi:hypothetical protein
MKINHLLGLLVVISVGTASCNLDLTKNKDIDYQLLATDASVSDNISSDTYRLVDQESRNGEFSDSVGKVATNLQWTSSVDTCAIVTLNVNGGNFPMTLTIDFGSGCTDGYGVVRKGKVIGVFSGYYSSTGTRVDVSFNNYYVNGYKVEGQKSIVNNGRNVQQKLQFSVVDANGRITKPDNGIITWESTRTHVWDEGESTPLFFCDDVYSITGTASGEISDGTPYAIRTVSAVKKNVCCPYVDEGVVTYSVDGSDIATIDYGGGSCDGLANITANGNTFVVVIQ